MKIKLLALVFLFVGCKSTNVITHPLLRTDGFYYRQKAGDIYHLVRFYRNGRVAISTRLAKKYLIQKYPNILMCQVDTSIAQGDIQKCTFSIKNDSIFFVKKPDNYPNECYDVSYAVKLSHDSLAGMLQVVNFDSTVIQKFQFGKTEIKQKITTSFKFIKASSKKDERLPDTINRTYNIPPNVMNEKMMIEEL